MPDKGEIEHPEKGRSEYQKQNSGDGIVKRQFCHDSSNKMNYSNLQLSETV